jgi:hypothetical protein
MQTEQLSLEHHAILQPRFQSLGLCLSEYSFASRYSFRREHDLHLLFDESMIWLLGKTRDGVRYLMPTEDLRKISTQVLLEKLKWADCFYPIPESWTSSFHSDHFRMESNRNDSDYVFKREKIANYPGRNLSAKRNLLKQFLDAYTARVVPYEQEHFEDGLSILNEWQGSSSEKETDFLACKDSLQFAKELGLLGYIVYIDEQPAAFILGEVFPSRLFVIHFSKGLARYKGIYPFLFKELACRLVDREISCLNWEQDLGIEGLRQSKMSYQPDQLVSKFRVFANAR